MHEKSEVFIDVAASYQHFALEHRGVAPEEHEVCGDDFSLVDVVLRGRFPREAGCFSGKVKAAH